MTDLVLNPKILILNDILKNVPVYTTRHVQTFDRGQIVLWGRYPQLLVLKLNRKCYSDETLGVNV